VNLLKNLLFLLLISSSSLYAGEWIKLSLDTISFKGNIEADEVQKFQAVFSDDIKKIIVDSGGGRTIVGLQIGQMLVGKNIEVEVNGTCMSSCANYIFAAGVKRIINNGIVGFYGNLRAFVKSLLNMEKYYSQWEPNLWLTILKVNLGEMEMSDIEIVHHFEYYKKIATEEDEFFAHLGISQSLFDRTQKKDKGMGSGSYSFLLPTPSTFEKYGFKDVVGNQSQEIINKDEGLIELTQEGFPVLID
jgi:hypothetical protein